MKNYYCPLDDITCPYYDREKLVCTLENPKEECDDYYSFCDESEEDEDEEQSRNFIAVYDFYVS